jgi:hypothetical protein
MTLDLTMDEILEDLCWPGLPPGRWNVPVAVLVAVGDDRAVDRKEEQQCPELHRKCSSTTPRF